MIGDLLQVRPVETHDVDAVVFVAIARETEALTVRRELGSHVHGRAVRQAAHPHAVGLHCVDFVIPVPCRAKDDQAAVR